MAPSGQMLTAGRTGDSKALPLPSALKALASPVFMLEKLKTSTFHPDASAATSAQGLELLLNVDAFDADVSIKVEEGIFLCAHPVGEVDDRAVGQLH